MQDRQEMIAVQEILVERAAVFEETIKDMEYQIERAMHAVVTGTGDVGQAMAFLTERRNAQAGLMFELGKVTAQIEDLEHRIHEQDERGAERQAVREWETEQPVAQEDHLDWLRPVLEGPEPEQVWDERHPQREGEVEEGRNEVRESEDYLDWWKR